MIKIQLEVKKDNIIELTAYEARALYNELKNIFEEVRYTYPTIFEQPGYQPPSYNPNTPFYTTPFYTNNTNFPGDLLKNNQI